MYFPLCWQSITPSLSTCISVFVSVSVWLSQGSRRSSSAITIIKGKYKIPHACIDFSSVFYGTLCRTIVVVAIIVVVVNSIIVIVVIFVVRKATQCFALGRFHMKQSFIASRQFKSQDTHSVDLYISEANMNIIKYAHACSCNYNAYIQAVICGVQQATSFHAIYEAFLHWFGSHCWSRNVKTIVTHLWCHAWKPPFVY